MLRRFKILTFLVFTFIVSAQANNSLLRLKGLEKYVSENYFSKTPGLESIALEGIELATRLKQTNTLANLNKMIGVHYYFNGNYELALSHYLKAIELYQSTKNLNGEASVYNELGTFYRKHKRYEEAIKIFDKAESICKITHDSSILAAALNNRGIVFETQENYPLALKQYQIALDLYKQINDQVGLSYSLENIGGIYLLQKDYSKAESFLKQSIEIRKQAGLKQATAMGFHYLGDLYQKTNALLLSNAMFDSCIKIANEIQYPDLCQRAYFSKASNYKALKEWTLALTYFERGSSIKDSLIDEDKNRVISELQTQYEVEVKNKENSLLKQGNELNIQKLRANRLLIILIVIGVVVLFGLSLFLYKKKQKTQEAKALEMVQNAEHLQRTRISNDLHDHVGAQLSYVVSNLDIASKEISENKLDPKRIDAISDMSKQAIGTLRETVWALNNDHISLESFADKFKLYCMRMLDLNEKIELNFHEHIPQQITLMPNTALHVFRICQEAFSNAVKHADASRIDVYIQNPSEQNLEFKIVDNGKGFATNDGNKSGHYGLKNMGARAEEIGGNFSIESKANDGTIVCITFKNNTYV